MIFDRSEGDHDFYRVVEPEEARGQGEMMVHMEADYPAPPRWPIHLGVKPKGIVFTNGTGAGYLRSPERRIGKERPFRRVTLSLFGSPRSGFTLA